MVEGSLSACRATCKQLLPPLTAAASDSQSVRQQPDYYHKPHQTQQLALSAILAIVKAAVTAAAAAAAAANAQTTTMPDHKSSGNKQMQAVDGPGEDPLAGTAAAVFDAVTGGQRQQGQRDSDPSGDAARVGEGPGRVLDGGKSGGGDDRFAVSQDQARQQLDGKSQAGMFPDSGGGGDDTEQHGVGLLRLQVLTELVAFPSACSPLSTQVGPCTYNQVFVAFLQRWLQASPTCVLGQSPLLADQCTHYCMKHSSFPDSRELHVCTVVIVLPVVHQ